MTTRPVALLAVIAIVSAIGCGDQSTAPATSQTTGQKTGQSAAPTQAADAEPSRPLSESETAAAQVAQQFLRAVLAGDAPQASLWLTDAATERYVNDPSILPPMGVQVERLEVGQVRLLNEYEAGVQAMVTEVGSTEPSEIGCLLKRESDGWRVCGLASDSGGTQPVLISFESPVAAPRDERELAAQAAAGDERTAAAPGTERR